MRGRLLSVVLATALLGSGCHDRIEKTDQQPNPDTASSPEEQQELADVKDAVADTSRMAAEIKSALQAGGENLEPAQIAALQKRIEETARRIEEVDKRLQKIEGDQ